MCYRESVFNEGINLHHKSLADWAFWSSAFPVRSGSLPAEFLSLFSFLLPLSQDLRVFSCCLTVLFCPSSLKCYTMSLALQHNGCNEALNLWCLILLFLSVLGRKRSLDNVLANIVFLWQVKQFPEKLIRTINECYARRDRLMQNVFTE